MNYGDAIKYLNSGNKVARAIWDPKSFIWVKPSVDIQEDWCKDPMLRRLAHENGGTVKACAILCKYTPADGVHTGWVPSWEDMIAEDWAPLS